MAREIAALLWLPTLLAGVVAAVLFSRAGGRQAGVRRWARTNGFRLVACRQELFDRGPFPYHVPRGQGIFTVTVEDRTGQVRRAYVRCNIGVLGLMLDESSVSWIEEAS
ncbi:MAG TPA: hypothetical protein VFK69_09485 [Candidatus Eisenbacteria bacterium]|nr:hypothetical protein [Candidatus Eisenbacteria bacterium]